MIQVYSNLYVGDENDYERTVRPQGDWAVIHACKDPYHRKLLGYTTQAAPKNHPEYLMARRGLVLYLNLVDAADPQYIPDQIIDAALAFIEEQLTAGKKVLVHCNQGVSRAPSIALLYLVKVGHIDGTPEEIVKTFQGLYPGYNPTNGIRLYVASRLRKGTPTQTF